MLDLQRYVDGDALFDGQYKLLRRLSEAGGTADVWLALAVKTIDTLGDYSDEDNCTPNEESGMKVAIKIYRLQNILDIEGEQRFKDEFKIVYNCHHANLLPPSHFSIFENAPYLVMPYCQDGSSEKLVGKVNDPEVLWKYILDVASGLSYLHACNPPIIHQDIKPANVLIDSNGNYSITDFGISAKKENRINSYYEDASSGTLVYMAPERFTENAEPLPESDIWALGATLFEIVTGDVPFGDEGGLAQEKGKTVPNIDQKIPNEIKKLIYSCLEKEPSKRPSAQQIVDLISERRLSKGRIKYIIPTLIISLLAICLAFAFINKTNDSPFDELCNSGDSIIVSIKNDISNNQFKIDDKSKSKVVQAEAFYGKVLTLKSEKKDRIIAIDNRVKILGNIINLYVRHKEVSDTVAMTADLDMPEQNAIYSQKQDTISRLIIKKIIDL